MSWLKISSFATLQFPQKIDDISEEIITPISINFSQLEISDNQIKRLYDIFLFRGDYSQLFEID